MGNVTIIYQKGEQGYWVATVAEVPGAISQGKTKSEARENVLDALNELLIANREFALGERDDNSETESVTLAS